MILAGEIYGKQTANKFVMYHVLKVSRQLVTLQNIDNPQRIFETTEQNMMHAGYIRVSQTPYIDLSASKAKRKQSAIKPARCPLTLDFLAERADSERPVPVIPDLFNQ